MVPVTVDGETVKLALITFKPAGNGPFPTLMEAYLAERGL